MCITTPAAALNNGGFGGLFNTTNGLCGPLAVGHLELDHRKILAERRYGPGSPALGGVGAVGVPNSVLNGTARRLSRTRPVRHAGRQRGRQRALPGTDAANLLGLRATRRPATSIRPIADGPSFAKSDSYGASATLDWQINDNMKFKSITGWRGIVWNIGTDLDGTPESFQEVTDSQNSTSSLRNSSSTARRSTIA